MNDTLASALSKILNAERIGQRSCDIKPVSNTIKKVLTLMNEARLIGSYKENEDGRGNSIHVNLIGKINKCGAIKARLAVSKDEFEKYEKRFLPAKGFGILVMSTVHGLVTHKTALQKGVGGKLIAYIY